MTDRVICCPHCGHEFRLEDQASWPHYAMVPRSKAIIRLRPGESAAPHPSGSGLIIVHPEHAPVWLREEDDAILCERLEPAEPGAIVPLVMDLYRRGGTA